MVPDEAASAVVARARANLPLPSELWQYSAMLPLWQKLAPKPTCRFGRSLSRFAWIPIDARHRLPPDVTPMSPASPPPSILSSLDQFLSIPLILALSLSTGALHGCGQTSPRGDRGWVARASTRRGVATLDCCSWHPPDELPPLVYRRAPFFPPLPPLMVNLGMAFLFFKIQAWLHR